MDTAINGSEALNLSAFQQEEKQRRRIQIRQRRVRRDALQLEVYVKLHEPNRFRQVYHLLAFDKIINEIAQQGSVGSIEFELLDRADGGKAVKMIVDHPELNAPGIKEKVEIESKTDSYEFTLYKALAAMDDFSIVTGENGGIHLETVKNLNVQ